MFTSLATLLTLSAYALASPIAKRQSSQAVTTVEIDDSERDSITYGGSWTSLTNQGDQWYMGTESYSIEPQA